MGNRACRQYPPPCVEHGWSVRRDTGLSNTSLIRIKSFKATTGNAGFQTLRFASVKRTFWSKMCILSRRHARPGAMACTPSEAQICDSCMVFTHMALAHRHNPQKPTRILTFSHLGPPRAAAAPPVRQLSGATPLEVSSHRRPRSPISSRTRPLRCTPRLNPAHISPDLQRSIVFRGLLRASLDQIRMARGARPMNTCKRWPH